MIVGGVMAGRVTVKLKHPLPPSGYSLSFAEGENPTSPSRTSRGGVPRRGEGVSDHYATFRYTCARVVTWDSAGE